MAQLLALAGFMGSGKTSVGAAAAALLDWRFVDLDEEFVRVWGMGIADCFAHEGEPAFRSRERDLLRTLLAAQRDDEGLVVALGGGALEDPETRESLSRRGGVVFLDVAVDEAWARVRGTGRPLAKDRDAFAALLAARQSHYEEAASWVIPVKGRTIEDLALEIAGLVRSAGPEWNSRWGRRLAGTGRASLVLGGDGALAELGLRALDLASGGSRFFVVTDRNVMASWGERIMALLGGAASAKVLTVEPGEGSKSIATLGRCWEWLAAQGARRDDVLVALGGGVVGDLGGFAAATYQRGISLWQIATSLLAQVDSSVGGKTAINLDTGKNLVGAFYQPDLTLIDPATLATLPDWEYAGALGEVVKHGLLTSHGAFALLEAEVGPILERAPVILSRVVRQSVLFKARVVEEDERENGPRTMLNLGHTVAHALEVVEGYGRLHHGQAVAFGVLVALRVSESLLGLDVSVRKRTEALFTRLGLAVRVSLPAGDSLLAAMARDKKVRAQSRGFVGLKAIGQPVWGMDVPAESLEQALEVIRL